LKVQFLIRYHPLVHPSCSENIFRGKHKGLYILNYQKINLCANKLSSENELWHKRLGHPSDRILNSFLNFPLNNYISCDICKLAKQTRLPFSLSISKSKAPFELIHSDVWGPAPTTSYNDFRYFVLFIDDFSRATWLYLLKSKSEVFQYFQEFVTLVENQFSTKIKIFRSDNGTEFVNNNFSQFLKNKGILRQTTCINFL
jgi:Integrase core domain/GAG-pre-integrase domain